ncbi:MAG TPA: hypothetical protein VEC35_02245 [Noviherbaspirillum sp.]|nr:hypothetical protein [Noviherbaspirillum sp.]
MKRQPKWIAALFAVLLALCGIYQTVLAQVPSVHPLVGTYVKPATKVGENTVVLRIKHAAQGGPDLVVYGALARIEPNAADNVIQAITGTFNPTTSVLSAVGTLPPALRPKNPAQSVVDGTYEHFGQTFTLQFRSQRADGGQSTFVEQVKRYSEATPFLVGIWQWSAADTSAALASAPQFSGEFYILDQKTDGTFRGIFSGANQLDVGSIQGQASRDGIFFLRSFTQNNQTFEQVWGGQAASTISGHTESIQGRIESTKGSAWTGEFMARWDHLR